MQDQILQALRADQTERALETARDWVARDPDQAQAHRWLSVALQHAGDPAAALISLDRAIALRSDDATLHLARGNLLLALREGEQASQALAQATVLDPNQLQAYLLQARLAYSRGEVDQADRFNRLAARVAPDHPQLAVIGSMVALERGDADGALRQAAQALERDPDDTHLLYTTGLAYMAKRHWAFAEQAFRRVLAAMPGMRNLRLLVSDLVARQGHPGPAADALQPLLDDPAEATPELYRMVGNLRMAADEPQRALPLLRQALEGLPEDRPTLAALLDAWRRLDRIDEAREVLDAALNAMPASSERWHARAALEPDDAARAAVIDRWMAAMPQAVLPLELLLDQQQRSGQLQSADATAARLAALQPAHAGARLHVLDALLANDPDAATTQLEQWLQVAQAPNERRFLLGLLGMSHDRAGRYPQAVERWLQMQALLAVDYAELPPHSAPRSTWPAMAERDLQAPRIVFLWGAPGSAVERLAVVMQAAGDTFRADRFSNTPPLDGFQHYALVDGLVSGQVDPAQVATSWRAWLPRRGLMAGTAADWLPWWDNSLLAVLRPHLPEATLAIAVRDPRDMLLEWLAYGATAPFAFPSPQQVAQWLAVSLDQVATLHEEQWFPNRILRTDAIGHDPAAATAQVNQLFSTSLPAPADVGPPRLPAGHWRHYAQVLADPFATLAAVTKRLGYPAD